LSLFWLVFRTVLIKDKIAYLQAGAGIVADSVPAREYEECLNKARAVLRAFELAEEGVVGVGLALPSGPTARRKGRCSIRP
jgi:hypothetical protein